MFLHVVNARHIEAHRVYLEFNDGTAGEIELSQSLRGPIFEPLHVGGVQVRVSVMNTACRFRKPCRGGGS